MMRASSRLIVGLAVCLAPALRAAESAREKLDLLAGELLQKQYVVGAVAAVVEGTNTEVIVWGRPAVGSEAALGGKALFPIGSLTKTFTALALAEMAQRGRVGLDDPLRQYLPESVSVPVMNGSEITLLHLATHVSGLPAIPLDLEVDLLDPYAGYTAERMYAYLSSCELQRTPGETYEYSDLGYGLLGHVLARRAGTSYERLIWRTICRPLGLRDTRGRLGWRSRRRLAQGYDLSGNPVPRQQFGALEGCGALCSTAEDLAAYLQAQIGLRNTRLEAAIRACHQPHLPVPGLPGWYAGLGWHVGEDGGWGWHDGGTSGSYAFAGFDRERGFGLVWLCNAPVWQIGGFRDRLERILTDQPVEPLGLRRAVRLDPDLLRQFAGRYAVAPQVDVKVKYEAGNLVIAAPGEAGGTILYAESETDFFIMEVADFAVSFDRDKTGGVTRVILHRPGSEPVAYPRIK